MHVLFAKLKSSIQESFAETNAMVSSTVSVLQFAKNVFFRDVPT